MAFEKEYVMSTSTDGQLCFGYALGDGVELPWAGDDFESWWCHKILGHSENVNQYTWCRTNPRLLNL